MIPGNSRTYASSDASSRRGRRLWGAALVLYAVAAAGDLVTHLNDDRLAGENWLAPDNLAVAYCSALFWPVEIPARMILAR